MQKQKVFISSVQNEFSKERKNLYQHLQKDPLLSMFFTPIMFEKLPAKVKSAETVYLEEVKDSQVYIILVGKDYGYEDEKGISPTEHEYNYAQKQNKDSLAFVKEVDDRHPKEEKLLSKIQRHLTYKRFTNSDELLTEVTKSLIVLLRQKGLIVATDFDESIDSRSSIDDISKEKIESFIDIARTKRGFPLRSGTSVSKVLTHLNMVFSDNVTNSAILAFSDNPQKYFPSAIVKCAHYHGIHVEKPIPDHRIIKEDVLTQVDQAVDFVLSKINVAVGIRSESTQTAFKYEIPRAVVAEAIVNAVAHRDYNSNGSVQVMLFADRLEVTNPGKLAPELSLEKLKEDHASYPANPLLAEVLFQAGYIERFGTGTGEIYRLSEEAGLKEPEFSLEEGFKITIWRPSKNQATDHVTVEATGEVTGEATGEVQKVVLALQGEMKRAEIQKMLDLKHDDYFRTQYILPALESEFIEMTHPDNIRHPNQKYRLTKKGIALKKKLTDK